MLTLKIYNITLRHAGNIGHEIHKQGVTDREVLLLRRIHGDDSVVNIKQVGTREVEDEKMEHFRLARHYGRVRVEKEFHTVLDGFEQWNEEQAELEQNAITARAEDRQRRFAVDQAEAQIRAAEEARAGLAKQREQPAPTAGDRGKLVDVAEAAAGKRPVAAME